MNTDGIAGVIKIESGKPGPTLGISACTHGNEPSGLVILKHLLDTDIKNRLQKGTLFLVINNIEAVQKYFVSTSKEEKTKARFIDLNMNRLPENMLELEDERYEIKRSQELYSIWKQFTVGFDIHSTSQDSPPMIISGRDIFQKDLVRGFPINRVLSNIDVVQIGLPAFGFYGGADSGIPVFEIEAGGHENPKSFQRAVVCAEALLQNLGMIGGETTAEVTEYEEYFIDGSVIFPDDSYVLTQTFPDFGFVSKGTVFATGDGCDLIAKDNCHTIFCKTTLKPDSINEEIMFLSEPVLKLVI